MQILSQILVPLLILLAATLWTCVDFWLHPVRDLDALPWPARRSLQEGIVAMVVWIVTSGLFWEALRWSMFYKGLAVGIIWAMLTLYVSTGLRQRAINKANRERGW